MHMQLLIESTNWNLELQNELIARLSQNELDDEMMMAQWDSEDEIYVAELVLQFE